MSETLRDTMNLADPNRLDRSFADVRFGDLLALLIADMTPTESAVVVASDAITLGAQPSAIYQVNVATGTSTGVKKLLKGKANPDGTITPTPNPGECTWDGGTTILFNTADAALTVDVIYAEGTEDVSILERSLGESDT